MIKIQLKTDDAAFQDNWQGELADVMADLTQRLQSAYERGDKKGAIRDSNGNKIGTWSID